jgi:hypothetical protein
MSDAVWVRVQDRGGAPIAGASVWIAGESATRIGLTDEEGSAHVRVPSIRPLRLTGTREGHASGEGELPTAEATEILLVLEPESRIRGTVSWLDGDPAPNVIVAAWPDGQAATEAMFRSFRSNDPVPDTFSTMTDGEGHFVLSGLAARTTYTLVAGGAGGLTVRAAEGVHTDGPSLRVELTPVYAATVRLCDADDGSLRSGPAVYGRGPGWYDEAEEDPAEVVMGLPTACFLVLDPGLWGIRPTTLSRHIVLLQRQRRSQDVPALVYEVEAPGYAPVWTRLVVPRIRSVPPEYRLVVEPRAHGWGTLTVSLRGPSLELAVEGSSSLAGQVLLEGEDGERIGIPIPKPLSRVTKVEGVPFGDYRARFRSMDSMQYFPDEHRRESVVVGDKPAALSIDASSSSCLLVTLVCADGREYQGAVVFRLNGPTGKPYLAFDRSPYVLEGIAPGEYTLYVDSIPGRSLPILSVPVALDPGSVGHPRIELPF